MSQPLFIFVLYCLLFNKCVICYFHDLKCILNDDSFKEYINPVVFINLRCMLKNITGRHFNDKNDNQKLKLEITKKLVKLVKN